MTAKFPKTVNKTIKGHTNLGEFDTIRLWVAAGGRCEICNDLLTESPLTFEPLNRAERAHIVGQGGPKAPRHHLIDSRLKADQIDNVMLLCFDCHHEIDARSTAPEFSVEKLQDIKRQHEERIWYLTELKPKRTRIVAFTTNIQQNHGEDCTQQTTSLSFQEMRDAVMPEFFPDQGDASRLAFRPPTPESSEHWSELRKSIKRKWERLDLDEVEHLSVYCLGKMPAIAYFGRLVGSTTNLRTMNVQTGGPVRWRDPSQVPDDFTFEVDPMPARLNATNDIVLCLSLSGLIEERQFREVVPGNAPVIHMRTPEGHRHKNFLIAKKQLREFRRAFSQTLSLIQERFGQECRIHLLMAAPPPIVFEVGRQHQAHHPILLLYNCISQQFHYAFTLEAS